MQATKITPAGLPVVQRCRLITPSTQQNHLPGFAPSICVKCKRSNRLTIVRAKDFDELLMETANKFEASSNKGAIVGWSVAAFSAITMAEWIMHLPLLDVLLGFPIQFLGLISAANLGMKYYIDKNGDPASDLEDFVNKVTKQLPGL